MQYVILLLLISVAMPALARDVYKWTSDDGVIQYSDTYVEGSVPVSVSNGKKKTEATAEKESSGSAMEGSVYESLEILDPENNLTVRSDEGVVAISLALTPPLVQGHTIQVYLDGASIGEGVNTTQFSLNKLKRGTHTLQVKVVDAEGNQQIASESVGFHMRKAAIQSKP
jgi:FlaG/FlaF family flagellin (archaellin)